MTGFACVPACIACRQAEACVKPAEAKAEDRRKSREYRRPPVTELYGRELMMPCGCCVIPIGVIHVLGDDIHSWFCDKHGWQKFRASAKKKMRQLAQDAYARELIGKQLPLPMEPPFLWETRSCAGTRNRILR